MMLWDPAKRPTASSSIQYPFFQIGRSVPGPGMGRQFGQGLGFSFEDPFLGQIWVVSLGFGGLGLKIRSYGGYINLELSVDG